MSALPIRLGLGIVVGLVWLGSTPSSGDGFRTPCETDHHYQFARNSNGRIRIIVSDNQPGALYWACWRPTNTLRFLRQVSPNGHGGNRGQIGGFACRSAWMVWTYSSGRRNGYDAVHSLNVRTGRRGPRVRVPTTAVITKVDGAIPPSDEVPIIALTAGGRYAWLTNGYAPGGREPVEAIYVPDGHGGDVQVAMGPLGSINRLSANRRTVRWTQGGRNRTARLP